MIAVDCPECKRQLKAPDSLVNQSVKCPYCKKSFKIPASAASRRVRSKTESNEDSETNFDAPLARPSKDIDREDLIDMTAMVDIVFFLLIFFLVTSMSGIQSSTKYPRPENHEETEGAKAQQSEDPQQDPNAIVVKITKEDLIEIEGVPFRELSDLVAKLHQLRNANGSDTSMLVVGHGDASHGTAVSVLDAGYEAGIDRLRLAVAGDEAE